MKSNCNLTPAQLDAQSPIPLDGWLDMNSEECKSKDDNIAFTKKCFHIGLEDGFIFFDSLGRIWIDCGTDGYAPFHFEWKHKLYGFRVAKQAAN